MVVVIDVFDRRTLLIAIHTEWSTSHNKQGNLHSYKVFVTHTEPFIKKPTCYLQVQWTSGWVLRQGLNLCFLRVALWDLAEFHK
jgi:hypothetical protein